MTYHPLAEGQHCAQSGFHTFREEQHQNWHQFFHPPWCHYDEMTRFRLNKSALRPSRCLPHAGWLCSLLALSVLFALTRQARASVAVLLEQPYGKVSFLNPTGHSALYFDHICAATPISLRPCAPGELGVVISRYDGVGTYDWIAIPLLPYLYAVNSPAAIPTNVDRSTVLRLRDAYRRTHLEAVAPDTLDGGVPAGNWYELVGSAYNRTIYGFRVQTDADQDARMIDLFNDQPNVSHYSGAFRNCADFVRVALDRLYPHAVRRNYIGDLGITAPKSVARGLTHYAHKHPEIHLQVFKVPQVPGNLPRSFGTEGVTESVLKRYGIPLAILSPQAAAAVFLVYVGDGRFAEPKDAPTLDLSMQAMAGDLESEENAVSADPSSAPTLPLPAFLNSGEPATFLDPSVCTECF